MAVNRTSLLDLPLPVKGSEGGLWGDIINNGFTTYVDTSVAGALSITGSTTLVNTLGNSATDSLSSTTAQYRTLIVPASGPSALVVITAPSSNRTYHLINLNSTYSVQLRAGANSGVTLGPNQSATVSYDSVAADYVLVGAVGPVVPVSRGGTGATTLTGYVKGSGTAALTAAATIPNTDITGLGTMSTQNANNVAITGGAINGTPIGATTASSGQFTTVTATAGIYGGAF